MLKVLKLKNYSLVLDEADDNGEMFYHVIGLIRGTNDNNVPTISEYEEYSDEDFSEYRYTTLIPIIKIDPLRIQFFDIRTNAFIECEDPVMFLYYWVMAEMTGVLHEQLGVYTQGTVKTICREDIVYITYANTAVAVRIIGTNTFGCLYGDIVNVYGDTDDLPETGYYRVTHELPAGMQKHDIKSPTRYTARADIDRRTTGDVVHCWFYLHGNPLGNSPLNPNTLIIGVNHA